MPTHAELDGKKRLLELIPAHTQVVISPTRRALTLKLILELILGRSRISATGRVAAGDLHVPMNLRDIIESIRASNHSGVPPAVEVFLDLTTYHFI